MLTIYKTITRLERGVNCAIFLAHMYMQQGKTIGPGIHIFLYSYTYYVEEKKFSPVRT